MHAPAYDYVGGFGSDEHLDILDLGGCNYGGYPAQSRRQACPGTHKEPPQVPWSTRDLFPNARWTGLDKRQGPGVNIVADATRWDPQDRRWDMVLCTEVLEHEGNWALILMTAHRALTGGGRLIVTCAGPGRPAHSWTSADGRPGPDEHYANVDPSTLFHVLHLAGFRDIEVQWHGDDLYATALKPRL